MSVPSRSVWTQSETIDTLYTVTAAKRSKEIVNAIFESHPFIKDLRKRSWQKSGGRYFEVPIMMDENPTVDWVSKGTPLNLQDADFLRTSVWEWKTLSGQIIRYREDDLENQGAEKLIDYISSKIDNIKSSLMHELELTVCADGTRGTAGSANGVQNLLNTTTPTSGSLGGIARTNSWWQHHSDASTGSFDLYGLDELETKYVECTRFGDTPKERPDWLLMGETVYNYFQRKVLQQGAATPNAYHYRYVLSSDPASVDLGVEGPRFHGMRTTHIHDYPSGRVDMVNLDYMPLITRQGQGLYMSDWIPIPNQHARVMHFAYDLQWIVTALNRQGTVHTFTA